MKNSPETLKKRNELKRMWKEKTDSSSFSHKIKKKCKNCNEVKLCSWNSSFTQTGIPEYKARCDKCHNEYLKGIRKTPKFRKSMNIRKKKMLMKRKQWAVDLLGGECKECGYKKSLAALTFHHKNPEEKEYMVGKILGWSENKIKKM